MHIGIEAGGVNLRWSTFSRKMVRRKGLAVAFTLTTPTLLCELATN